MQMSTNSRQLKLFVDDSKNDFWMLCQNEFLNVDQLLLEF